jgi:PAS domain S-box-containing protein
LRSSSKAIFKACTELIGAPAGYVALLTPDKKENQIVFLNPGGYICTVDEDIPMPIRGMRGEVVKSKKASYDNNFLATDWLQFLPNGHVDLENVLFVPLMIDNEVKGLMGMANKPGGFTEEDKNLAVAFSEFVSIALQDSQTLESLEKSEKRYKNLSNELEQKVIERTEELVESEERYRILFESSRDGIVYSNMEGKIMDSNQAFLDMLGYTLGEIKELSYQQLTPEKWHEMEADIFINQSLPRGYTDEFEKEYIRKDGTIVPISITAWLIKDDQRNNKGMWGIVRDISDRKKIEQTLKESEEKYKQLAYELETIIDHIPGVVVYKDTQNNILRVNKFTADAHNLQKEEMEGKSSFEIYPYEEAQAYWEDDLEVITSKTPKLNIVEPWETLEGKRWVNTSKIPYIDEEGNVKGIIAIAMDITEKKIAEEKIREQNEFLNNIIESLTHPFYVINVNDYTIKTANSASHFGTLSKHMKCHELTHRNKSPCQDEHPCPIKIVKETKKPVTLEHIHYDMEGNIRNIEIHGYPIIDREGNVNQIIEYSLDITDRKRAENELIEIKEFYKNVLDGFINGVWVTDKDDDINYTNKGMEKIAGISIENIIGANVLRDFPERTLKYFGPLYLEAKNSLKPLYYEEIPVTTPAGRESYQSGWLIPRIKDEIYEGMICTIDDVTERRRTEQKLKESEEKFSKAFHSSPTLMAITRMDDGFFIDVNETYTQTLGYSREELIGHTSLNLNLWLNPEQRSEFTRRVKDHNRIEAFDVEVYTKSSKILTMLFSGDIILLNNEPHLITTAIDITDRIKAEQDLKESEEKFRIIAEQSLLGISIMQDGKIKYANQAVSDINEYPLEEMMAWESIDFVKIIHPDDLEFATEQAKMKQLGLEEDQVSHYSYRLITKQQQLKWVDQFSKSILYEGNPANFITIIDITDRINAEQNLKESEEKYRNLSTRYSELLESITDAVYAINRGWEYTMVNKNAEAIIDMPIENLLGNKITDVFPGIEESPFFKVYEKVMNTQIGDRIIDSFILPDGNVGYYDVSVYPIEDGILCIGRNATEEIVIQEKLKESELQYRSLFENMTAAFAYHKIIVDEHNNPIDYKFLQANSSFEEFTNLKVEDIIGKKVSDVLPGIENDPSDWIGKYGKVALTGVPITFENYAEPLHQWYSVAAYSPKKDYFAVTFTNITERKEIEKRIKESEEMFRTLTEQSLMGICIAQDNQIKYVNKAYTEIWGYNPEEMMKWGLKDVFQAIHPDDREFTLEQLAKKQKGEEDIVTHYQYRGFKKSGEMIWVDQFSKSIEYEGRPANFVTIIDITDRKKAQLELEKSEANWRILVEEAPDIILTVDRNYRILFINKTPDGMSPEQAIGTSVLDYVDPGFHELVKKSIEQIFETGEPDYYEISARGPNDSQSWYSTRLGAIKQEAEIISVMLITTDITQKKKVEENLLLFKTIVESSQEPIAVSNPDGSIIYINPAHEKLFGYPLEVAKEMNYRNYYPPESLKIINNIVSPALSQGISWEGELDVFDANGRRFPLWERSDSILDDEGNMIYGFGLMHDISERKKAEEDLVIKNYALNSSINAIAISDLIGNLTFINPSFLKMWGYTSEDEVLGKKASSFWASEEKAIQVIIELKNKYSWSGELIGKKKNGSLFDVLLSASLVKDKYDNPICMMASFVDITERKRAEQLIIEENRKLKELSEMKRDIITRVSHELKTPLTSVHGASYYLLNFHKENMVKEVLEYVEIIHRGGLRLRSLVEDLIDISRLESGKIELKKNMIDITGIIKECLKDMELFANHRKISMKMELQDEMFIVVDKIRIGQVISNILSNAVKNTPPYGDILITLIDSEDEVSIQVKDTGVGITDEEQQLLFKKFGKIERYGKGMDVDTEGSGLGLFISKEIVELHNGSIFFESDGRNKGTTFTILLPKTR